MENRSPQDLLQSLSPVGKALFNKFGHGPTLDPPFKCIHQAFEFHARTQPEAFAVEDGQMKVTYGELDHQANCIAAHLRSKGVVSGSRVALLVERSTVMVVGILGVLKAGGAYVPLDGNLISKTDLAHALRDSDAAVVLFQRRFADRVSRHPMLCIEDSLCPQPDGHCVRPEDLSSPSDSACLIYTSDMMDDLHAVDIMHQNVTNLIGTSPGNLAMGPGLRVAQLTSISCDVALWEILGSLYNGSTLCLSGKTPKESRMVIKTVDIVIATPSMLAPHDPIDYPNIKVVAVVGGHCPKRLADAWAESVEFYNCCGPIETTIVNTMHLHYPGELLGIGTPTPNNIVYLLDERMLPVKIGDVGIMWAGGACVTRGYVNFSDKTAERYRYDPFMNDGSMMYNSGDLARWRPDGDLEHLGRIDQQVKIQGCKVELSRVAAAMESAPGVKSATAILIDGELWGFYTPSTVSIEAVQASAARTLPHYAVPTKYIRLNNFPETVTGTKDKRALQNLVVEYVTSSSEAAPPNVRAPKMALAYPSIREKHEIEHEWTTSAGSIKQSLSGSPSLRAHSTGFESEKACPTVPPVPEKLLSRPPSPLIDYPYVPFPVIADPTPSRLVPTYSGMDNRVGTSKIEWDVESRISLTSTWVNGSSTTVDTATQVGTMGHLPLKKEVKPSLLTSAWVNGSSTTIDTVTQLGTVIHLPLKKEIDPSALEGQTSLWADYEQEVLPDKKQHRYIRNIRHRIFNTYRHLFGFTLFFNICFFLAYASRHIEALGIGEAVVWNLGLSFFFGTDYFINACFYVCTAIPTTWPLRVRKIAAEVYHIDGFHTGIAVASILWCIYFTGEATKEVLHHETTSVPTLVLSWFIFILFIMLIVFSVSKIRHRLRASYENFDTIHSFTQYVAVILLWVQVPFLVNDYREDDKPLHVELRESSPFWLLILMTVCIALPWLKLRKVPVFTKELSPHAVRLYFDYTTPRAGCQVRISDNPLIEWNNLTAIPEPGKPGFSVILTTTGYWTSKKVADPPKKLWVQGVPRFGVMRIATLFQRIILVATGSGITSCMPLIFDGKVPFRLLWIASNARQTFGDKLIDDIIQINPEAVLYNPRSHGQPDLIKMTYRLVRQFDAEAVIVISNKATVDRVVYEMVSRGIVAFGSVGDEEP